MDGDDDAEDADASAIASRPSFAARGTNGPRTSRLTRLDDGDVDRRLHDLAVESSSDLLRDDETCPILRLRRRAGEMRRDDDLLELEERPRVRLVLEHVERCSGDLPGADRRSERLLVEQPAAGRVHDPHSVAHLANASAPSRCRVSSFSGRWSVITSASAYTCSSDAGSSPRSRKRSGATNGS